jgi:hypothetical protein
MNKNENFDFGPAKRSIKPRKSTGEGSEVELKIIRNNADTFEGDDSMKPMRTKLTREELLAGHSQIDDLGRNGNAGTLDPRFKNPDEFLLRAAPRKTAPDPIIIKTDELMVKKPAPTPASPSASMPAPQLLPQAHGEPNFGMPDLGTLRRELDQERESYVDSAKKVEPVKPSIKIETSSEIPGFGTAHLASHAAPEAAPLADLEANPQSSSEDEIKQWTEYAESVKTWQTQVMDVMRKLKAELKRAKEAEKENVALRDLVRRKESELKAAQQKSKKTVLGWMFGKSPAS